MSFRCHPYLAIDRAYQWANSHPEQYAAAQAKVTGLPLAVHLASASNTRFTRIPSPLPSSATCNKGGGLTRHLWQHPERRSSPDVHNGGCSPAGSRLSA